MDCTITAMRNALVDDVPSPSTRDNSSEHAISAPSPECAPILDGSPRGPVCSCRCEDIERLEQRLLSCEEDCKDILNFRNRLMCLEDDTKKNSFALGHVRREIGDLVDKIDGAARQARQIEEHVDEKLSNFVSKRSHSDFYQDSISQINLLKQSIADNKTSSENLLWLLSSIFDAGVGSKEHLSSFWYFLLCFFFSYLLTCRHFLKQVWWT